jgi:hypothetical protein
MRCHYDHGETQSKRRGCDVRDSIGVKGYSYVQQGEHEMGAVARIDAVKKARK